ncbi:MAG: MIP/aquaporin family protein [Nitrososphaera sp.]|uniref:MIP/aquaporin family protein n=1 Tax=Nitrososphaera sp. TaxID=1971748 RepID=UPI003D6FEF7A
MSRTSSISKAVTRKIFAAELIGTFLIVVFATGSVVVNARAEGAYGLAFEAAAPAIAVALMVYAFGKVSMAHFNPAVTVAFFVTGHIAKSLLPVYLTAEITGALLASAFVAALIGTEANLGANAPSYSFPLPLVFEIEALATALLMAVIYAVVRTKGLKGFGGVAIGGIIGLDILFLSFISGASMNPARALAPALLSGAVGDLWLYWSATFAGSAAVAFIARKFSR